MKTSNLLTGPTTNSKQGSNRLLILSIGDQSNGCTTQAVFLMLLKANLRPYFCISPQTLAGLTSCFYSVLRFFFM